MESSKLVNSFSRTISNDLLLLLNSHDSSTRTTEIADIFAALFEFTDNSKETLYSVAEELFKFAVTPLESENPFSLSDDFS